MFSYIMQGTNDLPGTIRFYDSLMELPGHPKAGRNKEGASRGTFGDNYTTELSVGRRLISSQQALVMARW